MKAEHRKELQTNALADGMGHLIQRLKHRPERSTAWLWVLGLLVIAAVLVVVWLRGSWKAQTSELWVKVDHLNDPNLKEIVSTYPNTNPGLAARSQVAFVEMWDKGIKYLSAHPLQAKYHILQAQGEYKRLAAEARDTVPTLASEALYSVAVAEETLSFGDPKQLDRAIAAYEEVVKDYKDYACGKMAKARLDQLTNEHQRAKIQDFYERLNVNIRAHIPEHLQRQQKDLEEKLFKELK